jgi:hypothetical protein
MNNLNDLMIFLVSSLLLSLYALCVSVLICCSSWDERKGSARRRKPFSGYSVLCFAQLNPGTKVMPSSSSFLSLPGSGQMIKEIPFTVNRHEERVKEMI